MKVNHLPNANPGVNNYFVLPIFNHGMLLTNVGLKNIM